jgi:FtsP/CotA-like multicopper oxidase with cupredoxin domain
MKSMICGALLALCCAFIAPSEAFANGGVCPRPAVGSEIQPPPDLFSSGGVLETSLNYYTSVDDDGRTLFCFVTPDGKLSPTLHVNPGDRIKIHLTNMVPANPGGRSEVISNDGDVCGDATMTDTSVNMHFHGLNVTPRCHGDQAIHTLVNSGETFDYGFRVPLDEPPGLYWYHPHVHGISSIAVQGGGTGIIEVEGISNIQPAVANLPERFVILRDEPRVGSPLHLSNGEQQVPNWDVSVNYVTVAYPKYQTPTITMQSGQPEFWRLANAAANTIMDLRVKYDGVEQPVQVVGYDGVPAGSQDGTQQGTLVTQTRLLVPPASRVEFIVTPPGPDVKSAVLETENIVEGGPAADSNPTRPLAQILVSNAPVHLPRTPKPNGPANKQRFEDLKTAKVTAHRLLYFSETPSINHKNGDGRVAEPVAFYITVDGQLRQLFDPNEPPAITTTQGAVEEWKIQNRSPEVHEFHMHQIHYLVEEVSGVKIPLEQQQFYDTFQVPYWDGKHAFPYIKVKLDFRGAVVGDFVYHCHILDHEDGGMMATIRVLPRAPKKG